VDAVDVECFAGGFTLGVAQAGFRVVGKRELPGGFGVPSVAANKRTLGNLDLDIQVGMGSTWDALDVPFVFGNPPCSAFSGVSDKNFAGADNKINDCMYELVDYAARCQNGRGPEVIVYESVQNAYGKGLHLLRDLHARLKAATGQPYVLYHVLHNAAAVGGAAVRKRYFWVSARIPIGFAYDELKAVPHLRDVIGDLEGLPFDSLAPQPLQNPASWWSFNKRRADGLVDGHLAVPPQYHRQSVPLLQTEGAWAEGENLTAALTRYFHEHGRLPVDDEKFLDHYGPSGRNFNFGGAWQPERWRYDRMARVVTGGSAQRSIHPVEPRPLTLREMYRIQGFPDTWLIEPAVALANVATATLWPGKGIPVQAGRWIASCARDAILGTPRESDRALTQLGEDEFTWDGTNDHRRLYNERTGERFRAGEQPAKAVRSAPTRIPKTNQTKETANMTEPAGVDGAGNSPYAVRQLLETEGRATVNLNGLDEKESKKARELLYAAAYAMGRKVKVRTDKASGTATGELVPLAEGETATPKATSTPRAPKKSAPATSPAAPATQGGFAQVGDRKPDNSGTMFEFTVDGKWRQVHDWPDGTKFYLIEGEWVKVEAPVVPEPAPVPFQEPAIPADTPATEEPVDEPVSAPAELSFTCGGCHEEVVYSKAAEHIAEKHSTPEPVSHVPPAVLQAEGLHVDHPEPQLTFDDCLPCDDEGEDLAADVPAFEPELATITPLPVTEGGDDSSHDVEGKVFDLQPKSSKREVKDRRYDLTQLRAGTHGYYVHRDYASHYFRWGWATRQAGPETKLLEVGCGQDLPLTRVFIYHNGIPKEMVSVDLNSIKDHVQPKWFTLYDETNFLEAYQAIVAKHGRFDLVTCFEVIEHMPDVDGHALLAALRECVTDDGAILLSTPVFNGKAAANHIHEWTIPELEQAIHAAGLRVEKRWGTFASYHDVKRGLVDWMAKHPIAGDPAAQMMAQQTVLDFYESLREFYADDVLANFMAPNLPDHARNNAWRLRRA
jgi:site-specific DNA-cytosine methylase